MNATNTISNRTVSYNKWSQLQVGDAASLDRICSDRDLFLFAHVSGNTNPLILPAEEGAPASDESVAPLMWVGSPVVVLVLKTDEERMIAAHTSEVLGLKQPLVPAVLLSEIHI